MYRTFQDLDGVDEDLEAKRVAGGGRLRRRGSARGEPITRCRRNAWSVSPLLSWRWDPGGQRSRRLVRTIPAVLAERDS
jgi:hypothetical protein